jgi:CubicO group peptidase (beta-lactamase class C family)
MMALTLLRLRQYDENIIGVSMKKSRILEGYRIWIWFIIISILISLLVALLSGSLQIKRSMRADAPLGEFMSHMNERIPALMRQYRIPGCNIALVKDCKVVWTKAYGYADMASGRELTVNTPMSVQSITKSVTAWGVMRLVERGLIDLEAPVLQYLKSWRFPQSAYPTENITARQLLSHTAGMPLGDFTNVYSPGEKMPSNREVMTGEAVLVREAGTGFSYSNTGYNLLEILIEDVTEQSFSEYISTEIFLPLGMESATFDIDTTATPYPPTGYNLGGRPVPVYLYPSKASGGLFATAHDIALFAAMGMTENPVLSGESIKLLYAPQSHKIGIYGLIFDAYGFGHYIEKLPNGAHSVSHGGQGNGIMTHFQAVPETGDAIIILTNSQRSWPFIAYVLSDWALWRGFPSVGMGRIIWGHYVLCAVIGMLISTSLLMVLRLNKHRRTSFRLLRVGTASILLGILIWCTCQKYLFITSVFPILSMWLGGATLVFSIVLLLSALLPTQPRNKGQL